MTGAGTGSAATAPMTRSVKSDDGRHAAPRGGRPRGREPGAPRQRARRAGGPATPSSSSGPKRPRPAVRPVGGHRSASSSARRRRARPRCRWVFTVPRGRSVACRDLGQRAFREEAERDDLPVGLVERGDGGPDTGRRAPSGAAVCAGSTASADVPMVRKRSRPGWSASAASGSSQVTCLRWPGRGGWRGGRRSAQSQAPNAPSARQVPSDRYAITKASCATSSASERSPRTRAQAETTAGPSRSTRIGGRHRGLRRARPRRSCGHRSWLRCPGLWSRSGLPGFPPSCGAPSLPDGRTRRGPVRRPTRSSGIGPVPIAGPRSLCQWPGRAQSSLPPWSSVGSAVA